MKHALLCFFLLAVFAGRSQTLTLTQAFNEPMPGDTNDLSLLDTSAYATGMPNSITGSNCVWNFTNLIITPTVIPSRYLAPAAVPSTSNYAACTVVQDDNGAYTYLKSSTTPTTQTEVLGAVIYSANLTFTNTAVAAKFPVSFGTGQSDNFSGSFTFSVTGTCSGAITTTADGYGTLNLPGGLVYTNVLRVKSVQTITLSAALIPGFPTPIGTIRQTVYGYYHASQKFPVLNVNYQRIQLISSSTPSMVGSVVGNHSVLYAGLKESVFTNPFMNIYPNPVNNVLHLKAGEMIFPEEVKLYSQLGQELYHQKYTETLDLTYVPAGIYFLEVKMGQNVIRRKIIKE